MSDHTTDEPCNHGTCYDCGEAGFQWSCPNFSTHWHWPLTIHPPAGGWSMEPQPVILPAVNSPAPTRTKTPRWIRAWNSGARKDARILARQIARSEHYIRARPLLNNGKAWR